MPLLLVHRDEGAARREGQGYEAHLRVNTPEATRRGTTSRNDGGPDAEPVAHQLPNAVSRGVTRRCTASPSPLRFSEKLRDPCERPPCCGCGFESYAGTPVPSHVLGTDLVEPFSSPATCSRSRPAHPQPVRGAKLTMGAPSNTAYAHPAELGGRDPCHAPGSRRGSQRRRRVCRPSPLRVLRPGRHRRPRRMSRRCRAPRRRSPKPSRARPSGPGQGGAREALPRIRAGDARRRRAEARLRGAVCRAPPVGMGPRRPLRPRDIVGEQTAHRVDRARQGEAIRQRRAQGPHVRPRSAHRARRSPARHGRLGPDRRGRRGDSTRSSSSTRAGEAARQSVGWRPPACRFPKRTWSRRSPATLRASTARLPPTSARRTGGGTASGSRAFRPTFPAALSHSRSRATAGWRPSSASRRTIRRATSAASPSSPAAWPPPSCRAHSRTASRSATSS